MSETQHQISKSIRMKEQAYAQSSKALPTSPHPLVHKILATLPHYLILTLYLHLR